MTEAEAMAAAARCAPAIGMGGEPQSATLLWLELAEDKFRPSPVRDVLCWEVLFGDADGLCGIMDIDDATGEVVTSSGMMT